MNQETSKKFTDSKTISEAVYFPSESELLITFKTGKQYMYYKVPKEIWTGMMNAESIGKFVNDNIKGTYQYKLIN